MQGLLVYLLLGQKWVLLRRWSHDYLLALNCLIVWVALALIYWHVILLLNLRNLLIVLIIIQVYSRLCINVLVAHYNFLFRIFYGIKLVLLRWLICWVCAFALRRLDSQRFCVVERLSDRAKLKILLGVVRLLLLGNWCLDFLFDFLILFSSNIFLFFFRRN